MARLPKSQNPWHARKKSERGLACFARDLGPMLQYSFSLILLKRLALVGLPFPQHGKRNPIWNFPPEVQLQNSENEDPTRRNLSLEGIQCCAPPRPWKAPSIRLPETSVRRSPPAGALHLPRENGMAPAEPHGTQHPQPPCGCVPSKRMANAQGSTAAWPFPANQHHYICKKARRIAASLASHARGFSHQLRRQQCRCTAPGKRKLRPAVEQVRSRDLKMCL